MSTSFTAACVVACFLISGIAEPLQYRDANLKREVVSARWRVDLSSSLEGDAVGLVVGHGHETRGQPRTSLWFLDNNKIAVTFVTREGKPSLSRRESLDGTLPLRIRAIFLDAADGWVGNALAWPTDSRFAGIVATHNTNFVVQRGCKLTLFSSDLREMRQLQLPPLEDSEWYAHASPTGGSILFVATNLRTSSSVQWIWVDTDTLEIVRSWSEVQSGWVSISDHNIAMTTCVWVYDCNPFVETRSIQGNWKKVALASLHNKPRPQFVNDDALFLLGDPPDLIRVDGQTILLANQPFENCWWGEAVPAANGQRFVVPSCELRGAVRSLDIGGRDVLRRVILYDAPFQGPPRTIDVEGPAIRDYTQIAISPNGMELAVLNETSVEVFPLPPSH